MVFATFGHVRLPFCMVFAIVFATFWHFKPLICMVFATFWYFKRSCGFLEGSSGVHLKFHLRFHLGFHVGFHLVLFRGFI